MHLFNTQIPVYGQGYSDGYKTVEVQLLYTGIEATTSANLTIVGVSADITRHVVVVLQCSDQGSCRDVYTCTVHSTEKDNMKWKAVAGQCMK